MDIVTRAENEKAARTLLDTALAVFRELVAGKGRNVITLEE